jgi:hypothetical protein
MKGNGIKEKNVLAGTILGSITSTSREMTTGPVPTRALTFLVIQSTPCSSKSQVEMRSKPAVASSSRSIGPFHQYKSFKFEQNDTKGGTYRELCPDSGMDRRIGLNIPCLVCVPEESTMIDTRLEGYGTIVPVRIPGIDMRIKVDHGYGSVDLTQGSKDR